MIEQASAHKISSENPLCVITGSGGSGKSMLMRHLFIDLILDRKKVPVFLELRELNQTNQSIVEFIQETLHSNYFRLDNDYIAKAMRAGHFAFLFDGFDELALESRRVISRQLLQLAKKFDKNYIFVSSRPDDEFSRWNDFTVFETNALTLNQACELVEKLPFDNDLKSKFLGDLRKSLYENHSSFLSNPLLLSIMLLTYGQSADIPNKLNVFYNQAYEALFQRHDALKGAFQRERSCDLDIQDFAKVFSAFSIQTYDKRVFQMSRSDALTFLEKSKRILSIDFSSEDYLKDVQQAVCLLVEDGLAIIFSHRSFQEYFVAKFIQSSKPEVQAKLIDKYSENIGVDSVMDLLYEISPELVERVYIIPKLEDLAKRIGVKKKVGVSHYLSYLKANIEYIQIYNDRLARFLMKHDRSLTTLVSYSLRHCGSMVGRSNDKMPDDDSRWQKYTDDDGSARVMMSKLKYRDEFVRDLSNSSSPFFFSKAALEDALNVKDALIRKHKATDSSLDKILDI